MQHEQKACQIYDELVSSMKGTHQIKLVEGRLIEFHQFIEWDYKLPHKCPVS